jgi:phytoene dehydrogenase-like protein
MSSIETTDAVVVGSGPNGLAAAITLARAGRSVLVVEAADRIGGGTRSSELTLPGFVHDVCSAIHPLGVASPFFRELPLGEHGLEWIHPPAAVAHPFEESESAVLAGSVEDTARTLGPDGDAYRRLFGPLTADWPRIAPYLLGPLRIPSHPVRTARFGLRALRSARALAERFFQGRRAQGLFAGLAAHSMLPLEKAASAAIGLVLAASGHTHGWPMPRGGSQRIADSLASYLRSIGGRIEVNRRITRLDDLPSASAYLFDVSPAQVVRIAGNALPARYRRRLEKFRHGPGIFKVDWALDGPIPWKCEGCRHAGTVHLGGTLEAVAESERAAWNGQHAERPFVLLAQQSSFDESRAPPGKHAAWAYSHVPHGSTVDMTGRIEAQVERYAPGFRDLVLARHTFDSEALEAYNPNYVGGDIAGGAQDLRQIVARPALRWTPYATPNPKIYLCSASTPPGGGVHGMCGYHAARALLARDRA